MMTTDSIEQIERKSNPKTGIERDRPAHDPHARHQYGLQDGFQRGGKQHRAGGSARLPQPREGRGEGVRSRNGERRKRRRADEGGKERAFPFRKSGIEDVRDAPREEKEAKRAGQYDKKRRSERKESAFFRSPRLSPCRERRKRGHGSRRKPPRRRSGQGGKRERSPREQPERKHGALPSAQQAGQEHAVQSLRKGQDAGRSHHGQHGGKEKGSALPRHEVGNFALPAQGESKIQERRALAQNDGAKRRKGGGVRVFPEAEDEEHPEPRFYQRFEHFGEGERPHPPRTLEVAAQYGEHAAQHDRGRKDAVCGRKKGPLQCAEGGCEDKEERSPDAPEQREEAQPRQERAPAAPPQSPLPRDGARERVPRPRRRQREKEAEEGPRHLIQPHAEGGKERRKGDAVHGADTLGDDRPQRDRRRPAKKAKVFHMYSISRKSFC